MGARNGMHAPMRVQESLLPLPILLCVRMQRPGWNSAVPAPGSWASSFQSYKK